MVSVRIRVFSLMTPVLLTSACPLPATILAGSRLLQKASREGKQAGPSSFPHPASSPFLHSAVRKTFISATLTSNVMSQACDHPHTCHCVLSVWTLACVSRSPLAQMEEERRDHVSKMKKMEQEMEQVFEMKVKEKLQKLRDSEAEVSWCFLCVH